MTWNIEQNRKPFLCMYLETFFINSKYLCRKGFLLPLSKTSFYTLAIQNFLGQMGSLQGLQILCLKGGKWVLLTNKASQVSGSTDPKKVIMSLHLARPEQTKEPKLKEKPKEDHTNIKIHIIKICDTGGRSQDGGGIGRVITFSYTNSLKEQQNGEQSLQNGF